MAAFIIANYLAFTTERLDKEKAQQQLQSSAIPLVERRITEDQAKRFSDSFRADFSKIGVFPIFHDETSGESGRYAAQFFAVIFKVTTLKFPGGGVARGLDDKGILIGMSDPDHPSQQAKLLEKDLLSAGFKVGETTWSGAYPGQTFDLFICPE